ncbi:General secretion pathway protein F OS=Candidatus Accumulibacter sp. BA-94 GN=epsF_4 PE=4 SV=1 [Gemmata massiliana]|uniref:General secretion pathway protein F n=1 Tax=Gemmata massiliana TaxID=1210884 RepID=A0A6P2DIJ3_9BACT|nr:hypothetical protein [Gemmata massiliana]VTS02418.1 General secretion pathway protein F OS=Candidatus Accumulibacter sp. BA-94 GN=epsF_4 PE=4 SV=1 [Gemmata massiliana]
MSAQVLAENRTRGPGLAVFATALHAILLLILAVIYLVRVPAAKKTFDEFGMTLPLMTLSVIRLSNWLVECWWTLVPAIVLLGGLDFFVTWKLDRTSRISALAWVVCPVLLFSLVGGVTAFAIELPMTKLTNALAP